MRLRRNEIKPWTRRSGQKRLRVAGVLAAVAALTALSACGSSGSNSGGQVSGLSGGGVYGAVPAQTGTAHSGTIKIAEISGDTPTWMFPVVPSAAATTYEISYFDEQSWRPLYWIGKGAGYATEDKALSLANDPVWSNGNKTVTVTLKGTYKWSDGQPVTAQDVAFFLDEMKAGVAENASNYYYYTPGVGIPDQVASVATPDAKTVVIQLTKAANPTWFMLDELAYIIPMPSHAWAIDATGGKTLDFTVPANAKKIYDYMAAQSKSTSTFASNPLWQLVDGPYKLATFNATNGDYTETPNGAYSGPHASVMDSISIQSYTSDAAELNALKAGALDIGYVSTDSVPESGTLKAAYNIFGLPETSYRYAYFNFKDTTGDFNNIIAQLYIRQALAHLVDGQGIIKAYLHGAGSETDGFLGQYPSSPYAPSQYVDYPYSPSTATSLLTSHGWTVVPNGVDTCAKPGTAANECGPGIPAGTKLSWNLVYTTGVTLTQQVVTDLASQAKSVGIQISLKSDSFNDIIQNDNDVASPKTENNWAMADFGANGNNYFPTTLGSFNTGGSYNAGDYSNSTADQLINASVTSNAPSAVTSELSYLDQQIPILIWPKSDWSEVPGLTAINKNLSATPQYFESLSTGLLQAEFWYLTK